MFVSIRTLYIFASSISILSSSVTLFATFQLAQNSTSVIPDRFATLKFFSFNPLTSTTSPANIKKLKGLEASSKPENRALARKLYADFEDDQEPQVPRPGDSDYDEVMGDFFKDQNIGRAVAALDNVGPFVEYFYKNDESVDAELEAIMPYVISDVKGQFENITPHGVAEMILYSDYPSIPLRRAMYIEEAFNDLDPGTIRWKGYYESAMKGLEERLDDMKDINKVIANLKAEFNLEKKERTAMANNLNTVSTLQGFSNMFPGIDINKGSELLERFINGISTSGPGEGSEKLDIHNIKRYYWGKEDDKFEDIFEEQLGWIEETDWTEDTWGLTSKFFTDFHAMVYALILHAQEVAVDTHGDIGDWDSIRDHIQNIVDMYSMIYKDIGDRLKSEENVDAKKARKDFIMEFTYPIAGHVPDRFKDLLDMYYF